MINKQQTQQHTPLPSRPALTQAAGSASDHQGSSDANLSGTRYPVIRNTLATPESASAEVVAQWTQIAVNGDPPLFDLPLVDLPSDLHCVESMSEIMLLPSSPPVLTSQQKVLVPHSSNSFNSAGDGVTRNAPISTLRVTPIAQPLEWAPGTSQLDGRVRPDPKWTDCTVEQVSRARFEQQQTDQKTLSARLFDAAGKGNLQQVCSLIRSGVNVDVRDRSGMTPLMVAVCAGQAEVITELLRLGANIQAENSHGDSAVDVAFKIKHYDLVVQLARAGALLAEEHINSPTVMADLIRLGQLNLATVLVQAGAPTDCCDWKGMNYLHQAVLTGNVDMIRLFGSPQLAARVDTRCNTPLHCAVMSQRPELVRAVLDCGSPLDMRNLNGASPVMLACQLGVDISLIQLLRAGCNPNLPDATGDTPLHVACKKGRATHVMALLVAGADPAAANSAGHTPGALVAQASDVEGKVIANLLSNCAVSQ